MMVTIWLKYSVLRLLSHTVTLFVPPTFPPVCSLHGEYISRWIHHREDHVGLRAGSVPIWYGGRDALDIFNPNAFVYYDVEDPQPALDRIKYLIDHPEAYNAVLKEPILRDGNRTIEKYFSFRDEIGGGQLKKRIRTMMGVVNAEDDPAIGKSSSNVSVPE